MNFNFGLASVSGGECYLRFDDTNPEAEKLDYITQIVENVTWLGHSPTRVTYSSDYFPQLYDLAVQLIRSGHAYVDHQTAAEIKASREGKSKVPSPWRNRPVEESIRLFDAMKKGKFDEGAATLRMRGDLTHPNPQMWDLVAYRIKFSPHPHVGNQWSTPLATQQPSLPHPLPALPHPSIRCVPPLPCRRLSGASIPRTTTLTGPLSTHTPTPCQAVHRVSADVSFSPTLDRLHCAVVVWRSAA